LQTVSNVLNLAKQAILPVLEQAKVVVDATAGNGNDTLFLAEHTAAAAQIYAFDIQAAALAHTREKTAAYAGRIEYILDSHENIDSIVHSSIDVAVFNLGYLPGDEHNVTTQTASTLAAVRKVLARLSCNGVCVIAAYPGHAAGALEAAALDEFLSALQVKEFTAGCYRLLNHRQTAPYIYVVEKVL
jgi:methylase of polypeptide subunit release factors